ncbi:hypothetical protein PSKAS_11590 [Peribacillus sp. N1]
MQLSSDGQIDKVLSASNIGFKHLVIAKLKTNLGLIKKQKINNQSSLVVYSL